MTLSKLYSQTKIPEFIRFCIVGILATTVHYITYLCQIHFLPIEGEWWTNVAYSIGYLLGFVCNLFLSARFTFRTRVTLQKTFGFVVTNLINYGLHIVFLNLFLWLTVPEQWAPLPTYACVVPINYILVRTVFRKLK